MPRTTLTNDARGVSPVLSYILIASIIVVSVSLVLATGITVITESQATANHESMNNAMTEFDSTASLVAFDGAEQATIDLPTTAGQQFTVENTGHVTIEAISTHETHASERSVEATLLNESLSTPTYSTDDYTVTYQSGGVWGMQHGDPGTATMISQPEFTVKDGTATLPFTTVTSTSNSSPSGGHLTLTHNDTTTVFPKNNTGHLSNPVNESTNLRITLQTPYYQAWGTYFEDRLNLEPTYQHDQHTLTVTLNSGNDDRSVSTPVTNVGGNNRLNIHGQGTGTIVDSYDSTIAPYPASASANGAIHSETGIHIQNGEIRGDVVTDGDVILRGNARITGDAAVEGDVFRRGSGAIDGTVTTEADIPDHQPIDQIIEDVRTNIETSNDNQELTRAQAEALTQPQAIETNTTPTVTAGDYHLSAINVQNDDLTFDVADGDIRIVVDGAVNLHDANVTIQNNAGTDNRVAIYTRGNTMNLGSNVTTDGDEAGAAWFYGGAGTNVHINGDVTGVVYTPGSDAVTGSVTVQSGADLYGATVGGNTHIQNQATYHFDTALTDTPVFPEERHVNTVSTDISYFHISHTELHVDRS